MKIAFIFKSFPALSETFILNQIVGLVNQGYKVDIFARRKEGDPKIQPDVKKYNLISRTYYRSMPKNKWRRVVKAVLLLISNLSKNPVGILRSLNIFEYGRSALSLRLFYTLLPFLDKGPYDIIYCNFGWMGFTGVFLKKARIKGKIITSFHGYDMSAYILNNGEDVYKKLFFNGDLFMPVSNYWKEKLIELGCDKRKIIVHRMGINLEKFKFFKRENQSRELIKVLTVGRLVEKKGYRYSIKAIAKTVIKHKNILYIIAGDGPLRSELESLVSELRIENYVKFLGALEQDEIIGLYEDAHIFILPSMTADNGDQEGIPVVLMEAQATGLPVISTYHSGIPEVVVDGKSGFLVPERDVDALAERLNYLIEHPEIWPEMGKAGRKFIEERYNIKKLNQRLVEIYSALLTDNANELERLKRVQ